MDQTFADALSKYSEGKISAEVNWSGSLLGATEVADGVKDGFVPISYPPLSYNQAAFPMDAWLGTLGLNTPGRPVVSDLQGMAAVLEYSINSEDKRAEMDEFGVVSLGQFALHANNHLLCKETVSSLDDAQGLASRVAGPDWVGPAEAVGLQPTFLSPLEQFEALQRGLIDCVVGPVRDMAAYDMFSVAGGLTVDSVVSFPAFRTDIVVNPEWWNSLPVEAQQIVWVSLLEALATQALSNIQADITAYSEVVDAGVEIAEMDSDFRSALVDEYASAREVAIDTAPNSVADPAGEIERLDSLLAEWETLIADDLGYGDLPPSWGEAVSTGMQLSDVDIRPWLELMWERIWLPNMPE